VNEEDQTDRRMMWIGAYLVALHAACQNTDVIEPSFCAKEQADKAVANLDEFNKQVEGR
jgi:hypothetical protein